MSPKHIPDLLPFGGQISHRKRFGKMFCPKKVGKFQLEVLPILHH